MAMEVGLARLVGFCVDIGLCVVYTGLFIRAMHAWTARKKSTDVSVIIPCFLVIMYIINTAQACLQAADIYRAFFVFREQPGGPAAYFGAYNSRILVARDAIFWILGIMTDILMIWRLYVIWLDNLKIIILPATLLLSGVSTGVVMFRYTVGRMLDNSGRLNGEVDKWWMITIGITITLNLVTPGLIVARLWYIARYIGVLGSRSAHRYKQIALVVMECGGLYTVILTTWLVIFATGSLPALWLIACILPTLTAIVPCLIILGINSPDRLEPPSPGAGGRPWNVETGVHISVTRYRSSTDIGTESRKPERAWSSHPKADDESVSSELGMSRSDTRRVSLDITFHDGFPSTPSISRSIEMGDRIMK